MRDVFAARKLSKALELSLQLARAVLSIAEEDDVKDDAFRSVLLDQPAQLLASARTIDAARVSESAHELLCRLTEDSEYDPATAARESESGLFLDLHHFVAALRRELQAEHARNLRLLPSTSFLVGVDGSRQSYMAFEVATRLCRQGTLAVVHVVEEQSSSLQLPLISTEFILEEYKAHCARLKLPMNRVTITSEPTNESVTSHLLRRSVNVDLLVVGAVGKGGPAIDQIAHVPRELLQRAGASGTRVLVVPPAPVNAIAYRQSVIVAAVDRSSRAAECLNAALKLARPTDIVRVVHFYTKPIVGDFDEQPFAPHRDVLAACKLSGAVDVLPLEVGATIAESVQDYVARQNASFLVVGRCGERLEAVAAAADAAAEGGDTESKDGIATSKLEREGEQPMGRVTSALLFSPRCAMCVCP